jgi:hypothetical protein
MSRAGKGSLRVVSGWIRFASLSSMRPAARPESRSISMHLPIGPHNRARRPAARGNCPQRGQFRGPGYGGPRSWSTYRAARSCSRLQFDGNPGDLRNLVGELGTKGGPRSAGTGEHGQRLQVEGERVERSEAGDLQARRHQLAPGGGQGAKASRATAPAWVLVYASSRRDVPRCRVGLSRWENAGLHPAQRSRRCETSQGRRATPASKCSQRRRSALPVRR